MMFNNTPIKKVKKYWDDRPLTIVTPSRWSEVYELLLNSHVPLVDNIYKDRRDLSQRGFVLWFTGLPSSGKSTIANGVYEILRSKGMKIERLDGDIVRQSLTKGLGFSKEDRDENIRRVGFVAKLLSKNGIGVIASFIEVFCKCPLTVCEKRDAKGLYKKARKGEIRNFTGISDPYEEPENPEIALDTEKETSEENIRRVMNYLEERWEELE